MGSLLYLLSPPDAISDPNGFDSGRRQRPEFARIVDQVDQEFQQHWIDRGLESAQRADDLAIARRISLALTGTVPSIEEIRVLESKAPDERIEWWVSRLLEDRRSSDYLAERFARIYVGTENGPFLIYRRRRFASWLSDQLHKNLPYDELAAHLLTDEGLWTDTPAVNFVTATIDDGDDQRPNAISLAGRTTRAFLGMRIDCLQCHDDNLGNVRLGTASEPADGMQQDFHQLAAFFAHTTSSGGGIKESGTDPYLYKYLYGDEEETVDPKPPYGAHLVPQTGTRRQRLAAWVTHKENKPFARAIVNRVWAMMMGRALVEPIDDIPLYERNNPDDPTDNYEFPPALETLAEDFVKHDFDLRHLVRVIAATKVFQMDSRADFDITTDHEDQWAVFPLTRLRPEQMAGSLIQSTSLKTIDADAHIFARIQRFAEQNEFIQRYGDTGEDEFEGHGGTIPQRLLMLNGQLAGERAKANGMLLNGVGQIAALSPTDEKAVELAYMAVLSRRPTEFETQHFSQQLKDKRGAKRSRVLEDLYWNLLNCTEFSWNH